jgi:hypothetical protein
MKRRVIRDRSGEPHIIGGRERWNESKIFDISTEKGLEKAEQYQERLTNKYFKVETELIGVNRLRIRGRVM